LTDLYKIFKMILHGALAQLGERRAGSAKVTGSSPVCSIEKTLALQGFLWFLYLLLQGIFASC
jgi:hypothetical protein